MHMSVAQDMLVLCKQPATESNDEKLKNWKNKNLFRQNAPKWFFICTVYIIRLSALVINRNVVVFSIKTFYSYWNCYINMTSIFILFFVSLNRSFFPSWLLVLTPNFDIVTDSFVFANGYYDWSII